MFKKILYLLLLLNVVAILYFLFWPADFEPVAYTPPKNPEFTGVFAKNNQLNNAEIIINNIGIGPEDIVIGPDSFLYTGIADGSIIKFSLDGKTTEYIGNTGGRPLGLKFDTTGKLIIADEYKGLLSLNKNREIKLLTNEVNGTKIFFADHLDITGDYKIYFSDASQRNHDIQKEIWELQPTGRLLSYDPATEKTEIEMEGLRFANGVAIGPNDEYLLITETFGMLIHKYYLKGNKKGESEIFNNEVPGYPDNINFNGTDIFGWRCRISE